MAVTERATPVAAVIAALSTLGCCLPLGFLGAVGLAGISVRLQSARPWLLGCFSSCWSQDSFNCIVAINAGNAVRSAWLCSGAPSLS